MSPDRGANDTIVGATEAQPITDAAAAVELQLTEEEIR